MIARAGIAVLRHQKLLATASVPTYAPGAQTHNGAVPTARERASIRMLPAIASILAVVFAGFWHQMARRLSR